MSNFSVSLRQNQIEDLKKISSMGKDPFVRSRQDLERLERPTIRLTEIKNVYDKHFGPEISQLIVRHTIGLSHLKEKRQISSQQVILEISDILEESLSEDETNLWRECQEEMELVISNQHFHLALKAIELDLSHEHIYFDSKIITDIRPVYNEDRDDILGSIISFTLVIEESDSEQPRKRTLKLDLTDVERLQENCESAIRKAKLAKEKMQQSCLVDTYISGEEIYDI